MNSFSAKAAESFSPLAIVGVSARAAAASAVQAGVKVVAVDAFGDLDLRALAEVSVLRRFPQGAARALQKAAVAGWMYAGGVENHPRLVDALAKIAPLFGCPGPVLRSVRNPWHVARALREAGVPQAAVRQTPTELSPRKTWLQKPRRSGGGRGIEVWPGGSEPSARRRGTYFQERIAGRSYGALFIGNGQAATFFGAAEHLPPRTGFHYRGSVGPSPLPTETCERLALLGSRLARRFGLVGLFGLDFILDAHNQAWVVEVNPRYTASVELYERAGLGPLIGHHLVACRDGILPSPPPSSSPCVWAKEILYAPVSFAMTERLLERLHSLNASQDCPIFADLSPAGTTIIPAGAPLLTVLADGATTEIAIQRLADRAAAFWEIALAGS